MMVCLGRGYIGVPLVFVVLFVVARANRFHFLLLLLSWMRSAINNTVDIATDVKNPSLSNYQHEHSVRFELCDMIILYK